MNKMGYKLCMIFLFLALASVADSSSPLFSEGSFNLATLSRGHVGVPKWEGTLGEYIGQENELMMDSEINQRQLADRRRYISYGALRANHVPCSRRGASYYNCGRRVQANPYQRGCTIITRCARHTG